MDVWVLGVWLYEICALNGSRTLSFLVVVLLLLLNNHESPITIEVIQLARAKKIEIPEFPAHTTHILHTLDVTINGQAQVDETATHLKFNQLLRTLNRYMRVWITLKAKWKS